MAEITRASDRGRLELNREECKGCGLCVEACPLKVLRLVAHLNRYGYHPVSYMGEGCSGCGICFFACPEPGAIAVWRGVRFQAPFGHRGLTEAGDAEATRHF